MWKNLLPCLEEKFLNSLTVFSAEFFFHFLPAGCMRDVRLNGRYMPLDSQARDGVSQVSMQGLSPGCSSDSCKKNQCSPPFTCVDLWRVHECRYKHASRAPSRSARSATFMPGCAVITLIILTQRHEDTCT